MVINDFNIEKTKAVFLFIINKLGEADLLTIFKILYFAEQKHLAKYGSLIIDNKDVIQINGTMLLKSKEEPNLDYLSKSNIDCIEDSLREKHTLDFQPKMNYIEMAKAGGANDEMVKYIKECFEIKDIEIIDSD